jgi:hypothetical protein
MLQNPDEMAPPRSDLGDDLRPSWLFCDRCRRLERSADPAQQEIRTCQQCLTEDTEMSCVTEDPMEQ